MSRVFVALVGSVLTAVYWWLVFVFIYAPALFAGDQSPAARPPPEQEVLLRNGAAIVAGIVIYAVLSLLWRRWTSKGR